MEKPKRKYTLTEKALAANRRNLILAREVDTKIRFRNTPKRLAACRANMIRAHEVLRAASLTPDGYPRESQFTNQKIANRHWPDSPAYGTGYTRGLYAVSLRRSGRLAGEADGAFDAHVAQFVAALGPRDSREQRLARGIAQTVWRRLRAFRGQARYERACLGWLLQRAVDGRDLLWLKNGRPGPGPFAEDGKDKPLTAAERAANLAWEIERNLASDLDMLDAADKLNVRLERLSRLWVAGRGGDPRLFESAARGRVRDGLLLARPPESMGNPFLRPCEVSARMADAFKASLQNFSYRHGGRGGDCGWSDPAQAAEHYTRFDLMREFCRVPDLDEVCGADIDAQARGGARPSIESLPELEDWWMRAWDVIHSLDHATRSFSVQGYTADGTDVPPPAIAGLPAADPQPATTITQTLWSRLQLYSHAAEKEATEVDFLLQAKINGRMQSEFEARMGEMQGGAALEPALDEETGVFLMELVLLFNRTSSGIMEQRSAAATPSGSLHDFLVQRFGPSDRFDLFISSSAEGRMREWLDGRRSALEHRWAQNQAFLSQPPVAAANAWAGILRAEENVKLAAELASLTTLAADYEQEILDRRSDELVDQVWAGATVNSEHAVRFLAAASTGMVPLPGWKFESPAQCRARVGLGKKGKGRRVKVEG